LKITAICEFVRVSKATLDVSKMLVRSTLKKRNMGDMIDEDHHKCELLKKGANYLKWLM
jgi:phage-related protein